MSGCPTLAFFARVGIRHKDDRGFVTAFNPSLNLESLHARQATIVSPGRKHPSLHRHRVLDFFSHAFRLREQ